LQKTPLLRELRYLRTPKGEFTTFDVPGSGSGPGQGTFAGNIDPAGAITGDYVDVNGVFHGFVRNPDGRILTFDAPGSGDGAGQGTGCHCFGFEF